MKNTWYGKLGVLGVVCLSVPTGIAAADQANGQRRPSAAAIARPDAQPAVLRRLPVSGDDIRLAGETAVRQWPVYLAAGEAVAVKGFQLSLVNAVSDLPEASSVTVLVNDTPIGRVPLGMAQKAVATQLKVPPGLLVEGFNAVRLIASQRHRVDCSVEGTYELWADVDPAATGFVLPAEAQPRRAADLAALAGTGAPVVFRMRHDEAAGTRGIERGLSVLQSLALIAGTGRAQAELNGPDTTGPAVEVVVGTMAALDRPLPADGFIDGLPGVAVERTPDGATVYVVQRDDEALDAAVAALAKAAAAPRKGHPAGLRALQTQDGIRVEADRDYAIGELGGLAGGFDGRLFRTTLRAVLPQDFYAAGYGRAELTLQGGYGAGAMPANGLVVRVNGRVVSSLGLNRAAGGSFHGKVLKLPYTWFKPGANTIDLEATVLAPADQMCDPNRARSAARLLVGAETSLRFTAFAHATALPNLAATLGFGTPDGGDGGLDFTVSASDRRYLDGVATFVVRTVALRGSVTPVRIALGAAPREGASTIFVGPAAEAPVLASALAPSRLAAAPAAPAAGATRVASIAPADTLQMVDALGKAVPAPSDLDLAGLGAALDGMLDAATGLFRSETAGAAGFDASVPAGALVAMQTASPPPGRTAWTYAWDTIAGRPASPAVTTVITAEDADTFKTALAVAVAGDAWERLDGASAAFDPKDGTSLRRSLGGQLIGLSGDRSPGNARLVVAGWLSSNTTAYLTVVLFCSALLGIFTVFALRRRPT
jgi:hypothetical protein